MIYEKDTHSQQYLLYTGREENMKCLPIIRKFSMRTYIFYFSPGGTEVNRLNAVNDDIKILTRCY